MVKPSKGRCLVLAEDSALSYLFGWLVGLLVGWLVGLRCIGVFHAARVHFCIYLFNGAVSISVSNDAKEGVVA
jgi:hypothetical protein